ncbi:hypothetical protein ACJMK2_044070 [Sinanodonta woodiana]|uniref:Uncharacterized protein n=1 Tax=Sinanodonta woodiana TaxID=1069815 RepID=A0ABD3VYX7_SINWO
MADILRQILDDFSLKFCKNLTNVELSRLGVSTFGDRLRFREKIKQAVEHMTPHSSRRNTEGRTWAVTFVCLADINARKVLSTSEKSVL